MSVQRQQQDLELWRQWKQSNDPEHLKLLLDRMNPLVQREVQKWGAAVPREALESKGRLLTVQALKTYDPSRGAAVGTHVTSRLRKLSRDVYPYQNVARLPENKQLLYNTFQVATNNLIDQHGREPTTDELANELSWTPRKVADFQKSFSRRELVESAGAFMDEGSADEGLVDFYHHGLTPADKLMFEDLIGFKGKPALNNAQLMKKYSLTQGQLSYKKRKFINDLRSIQQGQR
jgi:DNA-directed RNA polymerase specialized sigma subunit